MKHLMIFKAEDGTVFDTEQACIDYETAKNKAAYEKALEKAKTRLEAAKREIATLKGDCIGPNDYVRSGAIFRTKTLDSLTIINRFINQAVPCAWPGNNGVPGDATKLSYMDIYEKMRAGAVTLKAAEFLVEYFKGQLAKGFRHIPRSRRTFQKGLTLLKLDAARELRAALFEKLKKARAERILAQRRLDKLMSMALFVEQGTVGPESKQIYHILD